MITLINDDVMGKKMDMRLGHSRRHKRLVQMLLRSDMLDMRGVEMRAMHRRVAQLSGRRLGRCAAMMVVADEFCCSYERVRSAVYKIDKQQSNFTTMDSTIKINNEAEVAIIDIEGTIGISESWQFDNPESRVATYERFRECVARIADLSNAHIRVNIRSTGGDVNDALLIYEALRATGAHVTTCCYGYTASAATIVAQAASEGCRYIAPTSLYLVHNSLCTVEGNAEEIEAEVALLRQTDERIAEIYARHAGRTTEEMAQLMSENCGRGRWLSPAEVVEAGLADAIEGGSEEYKPKEAKESVQPVSKGIKALLSLIGGGEDEAPDVADDVNYIPHEVAVVNAVEAQRSAIALEEQQGKAKPTQVKSINDPDLREMPTDERRRAYDTDARAMRIR